MRIKRRITHRTRITASGFVEVRLESLLAAGNVVFSISLSAFMVPLSPESLPIAWGLILRGRFCSFS